MRIYAINTLRYPQNNNTYKQNQMSLPLYTQSHDYVTFSGLFSRRKNKNIESQEADESGNNPKSVSNENERKNGIKAKDTELFSGLKANEILISLKLGDTLHRLDDSSLVVVGNLESSFLKLNIKRVLTEENSFIPKPKNIKNVYIISDESANSTFIIARKDRNQFYVYGDSRNLSNEEANDSYAWVSHKIPAKYNDLIETGDKIKFRLLKTDVESNKILYDAKFPVECFFTEGLQLKNGFVIDKTEVSNSQKTDASNQRNTCSKESSKKKSITIPTRTFADIAGMDDTVDIVKKKVLFPLLYPEAFPGLMNRGTILYGPPGTGKTLLALAVIGEAKKRKGENIHFVKIDSKELERSHFGESEALWRNVFKELEDNQPSLLFIDEIDSILPIRREGSNNVPNNSVVSQFLTLLDRLEKNKARVAIIGTTNRVDMIDGAIKRKGRLGNLIEVKRPDEKACFDILNFYLKDKKLNEDVNKQELAKKIYDLSYSGADIANLLQEATDKMYTRCSIYEKMDNGTFKPQDLNNLEYINKDFEDCLQV